MTKPAKKMVCLHYDSAAGWRRVKRSVQLRKYAHILMTETDLWKRRFLPNPPLCLDTYWQWVCCAPIKDIVAWARARDWEQANDRLADLGRQSREEALRMMAMRLER